jgi:hypothetical protein
MKASEILKAALELLESKGWTKEAFARDVNGKSCDYNSAVCFCGIGAVRVAICKSVYISNLDLCNEDSYITARDYLDEVSDYWLSWQDAPERTFPEVKAKFLEAIALAEQAESNEVAVG